MINNSFHHHGDNNQHCIGQDLYNQNDMPITNVYQWWFKVSLIDIFHITIAEIYLNEKKESPAAGKSCQHKQKLYIKILKFYSAIEGIPFQLFILQMDIYVQEMDGKLICLKSDHNESIIKVIMEDYLQIWVRLICVKCLEANPSIVNILDIDQVQEMIKDQMKEKYQQWSQNGLLIIKEFQQKIKKIQSKVMKDFEEIQRITDQWINENEYGTKLINLIPGLELLSQQRRNIVQSSKINQEYLNKLYTVVQELINNDINQTYDQIQNYYPTMKRIYKTNLINKNNHSKILVQEEDCYAIAFNNSGSIMVAGLGRDMKVWQFGEGKIKEKQRLTGHTDMLIVLYSVKRLIGLHQAVMIVQSQVGKNKLMDGGQVINQNNNIMILLDVSY